MSKKIAFIISLLLLSSLFVSASCTETDVPETPKPSYKTWDWDPSEGNIIDSETAAYFPRDGAYTSTGNALTLSWSADGSVEVFILSQEQFDDFTSTFEIPSAYGAVGTGASGSIKFAVKDTDTYYGVITSNSPVKLNWAKLKLE